MWLREHDRSIANRSEHSGPTTHNVVHHENGDLYNGAMMDGRRSGFGVLSEATTGLVYSGTWKDDVRSGSGSLSSRNQEFFYDGEWVDNKRQGMGTLVSKEGKYNGNFF